MLTNFEEITYELSDYEKSLLPNIVKRLSLKIGEWNAITSTEIIRFYKAHGKKMNGPRWRKIVNYIRVNNLVPLLISTSKGYYVATTDEEVKNYLESLKQRINSITAVYDALEYQKKTHPLVDATKRLKQNK